ncbi:MAG: hypothetical protein ACLQFR_28185 [Streptosporangiaceae bacterium]
MAGNQAGPDGRTEMNWLWINLPLAAVFFVAMTAIPLWLTFRRTDTGPNAVVPARAVPRPAQVSDPRLRELVGAGRI